MLNSCGLNIGNVRTYLSSVMKTHETRWIYGAIFFKIKFMKDSTLMYRSFFEAIKELPKEIQSDVYNAIFDYDLNDINPELNGIAKTVFTLIKPQLDANKRKYQNGTKGGRPIKQNETKTKPEKNQNETKIKPNVNDNDNANENNNVKEKQEKAFNFRLSLIDLGVNEKIVEDFMKVRKTKNATNTETAFNKIKSQILKSGKTANECIILAVEKDWKGFEADWIKNNNTNYPQKEQPASHVHTTKKETIADFGWEEFLKK